METINALVQQTTSGQNLMPMQSKRWPHLQQKAHTLLNQHGSAKDFMLANNPSVQLAVAQDEDRAVLGAKNKLDEAQFKQLAQMIRDEFGYLKATEVMLFLWRLKAGHYGEFYGSVDMQRIMRALRGKFTEERVKIIDRQDGERKDRERQERIKTALKPHEIEALRKRLQQEGKI